LKKRLNYHTWKATRTFDPLLEEEEEMSIVVNGSAINQIT